MVAEALNVGGFAALLFDLLTPEEELDRANVFDIGLLAERLLAVTRWVEGKEGLGSLPISYFGASTGAAAGSLGEVVAPTLLIVGGADRQVLG
jgi:putative phosphoribosyl transferase